MSQEITKEGVSRVEDPAEAEQKAYEVKNLVGKEIDAEFKRLKAMEQFPGLEEEVTASVARLKELYQDAEETLEGKKYSGIMKYAFEKIKSSSSVRLFPNESDFQPSLHPVFNIEDFVKYLEVKFGPKMFSTNEMHNSNIFYLSIKGTDFIFRMDGSKNNSGDVQSVIFLIGQPGFMSTLHTDKR